MGSEAWTVTAENAAAIAKWCRGQLVVEHDAIDHSITSPGINILCGSEVKRASVGDIVIRNHDRTFDIFK